MNTSTAPKRAIIWKAVSSRVQAAEDKISLSEQERLSREICTRNRWAIVDVLTVPGHSRDYIDIHKCAADMRAAGIDAFDKLIEHWKLRDFDVLVTYDADRFARTQTLHAYVTETTVRGGAMIYSVTDGEINANNYRMWISMSGYRAAAYIDRMRSAKQASIPNTLQRGLSVTGRYPFTHQVVRDGRGKPLRVEFKEELRDMVNAAVGVLLSGVSYWDIGPRLMQLGHVSQTASASAYGDQWYKLLHNPVFWGHQASGKNKIRFWGPWVYDRSIPPPEGMRIVYDVLPSVLIGEQAERVKAELRRRTDSVYAPRPRAKAFVFSSLLICSCGCRLVYEGTRIKGGRSNPLGHAAPRTIRYRCPRRQTHSRVRACDESIYEDDAIKWVEEKLLKRLIRQHEFSGKIDLLAADSAQNSLEAELITSESNIATIDRKIQRLIVAQSSTDDANILSIYSSEIAALGKQRIVAAAHRDELKRTAERYNPEHVAAGLRRVIEVKSLWELPSNEINSILHQLLGGLSLQIEDGKVKQLIRAKRRPRRQLIEF